MMYVAASDSFTKINIIHSVHDKFMPKPVHSPRHRKLFCGYSAHKARYLITSEACSDAFFLEIPTSFAYFMTRLSIGKDSALRIRPLESSKTTLDSTLLSRETTESTSTFSSRSRAIYTLLLRMLRQPPAISTYYRPLTKSMMSTSLGINVLLSSATYYSALIAT